MLLDLVVQPKRAVVREGRKKWLMAEWQGSGATETKADSVMMR